MPISNKILDEIDKLDASNEFKRLLISFLEREEKGSHKKNLDFEKLASDYVAKKNDSVKGGK